jgi:hypothetical protein
MIDIDLATKIGLTARGRRDVLARLRPVAEDPARAQSGAGH